jgi:hypothetical protein
MILGLSMPGGSEWLLIIFVPLFLLAMPILAIIFYLRSKELEKQNQILQMEKNDLLRKLSKK